MRIEPLAPPTSFADFCDMHIIRVVARERPWPHAVGMRWYVSGDHVEIMDGGILISAHGNGDTPEEALEDYARQLRGQRVVIDAYQATRTEIQCPSKWL